MRSGRVLVVPSRFLLLRPGCLIDLTKMFRCLPVFFDLAQVFPDQITECSKALPRILYPHVAAAQSVACVCMPPVFQDGIDFWRCFSGFVSGSLVFCLVTLNRFSHMASLLYRFSMPASHCILGPPLWVVRPVASSLLILANWHSFARPPAS